MFGGIRVSRCEGVGLGGNFVFLLGCGFYWGTYGWIYFKVYRIVFGIDVYVIYMNFVLV